MSNIGKACTMPTQNLGQQHGDRCGNFDKCSEVGESNSEHLVAECLTAGAVFTKWEEEPLSMQDCTVQVDSTGFFFCYTSDVEKETVCIDLAHVSDVRPCIPKEKIRDMLESVSQEALSERSFALVFGSNMVEVNFLRLVSPSVKLAKDWINALQVLIRGKRFQNPSVALLLEKQYVKSKCMRNPNGKIPIKSICKCLTTHRYEQRFYDGMQTLQLPHEKNDEIDPDEFTLLHFYKLYTFLCPRQDLDELFSKKCGGRAPFMKLQQVVDFINGEQRDPRLNEILFPFCSPVKASKLIETYEPSPELSQTNRMSFDGLARYLMSEDNLILKKDHLSNKHDLSHPLSHYFIHSSHNTYLIGRQFGGKSSVEMYRQCLLAGCRCIELDCWDGLGDEPIITHGKALCTNILFKDVIVAIKESAFVSSPLPVILSFENHCSRLQQRKLAEYCIEIFGDMLLLLPLDSHPLEEGVQIPPPNQLLYKILIKNKKLNPEVENDLLISESLDCLSEKQLQAMVDSASEMNDNPDPQASVDSSHLGLRPALIQKRLSVITEGRVTADSNKADTPTLGSPEAEVGMDVAAKEESIAVPTLKEMIDDSLEAAVIIRSNGVHASDADARLGADDVTDRSPLSPTDERMVGSRLDSSLDPLQEWLATVEVIHALEEEARNGETTNAATGDVFDSAPDTVIATKSADSLDSITVDNARKISASSRNSDEDTDNRDSSDVKVFNKNQQAKSPSNSDKTFNSSDDFNNSCREERNKPKKLTINLLDNVDWISTDGKPIDLEAGKNAKSPEGFNGELNIYSRPVFHRSAEIRPPYNDIEDSTDPNNEYKDCSKRAANSQSINNSMSSLSEENLSHHNQKLISSRVLVSPSLPILNNSTSHRSISICNIDLTSRSPNTGPKSPNTGTKSPSTGPKSPNTGPKSPSTGPKSPNIGPIIPSTEPKSPKTGPKSPRTGPKSPDGSCFSPDADYEIAVSQGRTRTESVQSDISESSIEDITKPLSMTVYENSIRKNRKTPTSQSGGSISARKFADSLRRNKSPISKQMSFNEKLFKFPMQGKSFSIESQDYKRQRMPTNGSTDDCNDSDDDFRRVNHPRSASSTSSCSLGSISKPYKKNSRGISFTSEDEEMASQQFYSHKNIDPLLSSLVNYVQPTVFQSFEHAEEQNLSYKMSSFNESSAIHFVKNGPVEFNKYNKRQFSRIYPKGTRVDSTNYNPQAFWNVGCQMVTLNLQTTDLPFQLNQAKFEANSQLGYLLKPEIMRRSAEKAFDSFTESPLDGIIPATVVIKVISGQFLTDKKSQTYVMVELYGLPADTKRKNKTKLVSSNYMNTLFNDESFEFSKVILPELVLVRFAVYDESDRVLGQVVLPLEGIQPGYRHIPLKTESGHQCQLSTLFVHISLKTYVPEKFADFADRLFEPMKYETQVEKRSKQMKKFDISEIEEDTDIPAHSNPQDGSTSPLIERKISSDESGLDSIIKVEEYVKKKERVTFEDFQHDKQYLKLLKKHQKDLDVLEKKHEKERANMQKVKQTGREKIKASFEKNKMSEEKMLEKLSKRSGSDISNDILTNFEQKIKYLEKHMHEKLVESASKMNQEEAEMTAKHIHERVGMRLYQVAEQLEYLKSLLHQSQQQEEKLLREKFDRQMTELKKKQAKQSIDAARSISAVKAIKSKEEKERLQREQDRQNMGIFISGRQELMKKQEKEMEDLRQRHREDIERMEKEHNKIMENEKNIFRKVTVAKQQILHS